ncbi:PLAA family ubiquitin binding-domain-containing protein, partial [Auriculariales sp. MPI-PUGE-AT-0066]
FSESPDRWASEGDLKSYDEEVARQTLPSQQVGDVKKSDLPGLEALGQQGRRDGQNLMILNGENVEAYQWSMATASWQKIGDVVDAPGPGRRQIYDGREYDYVFDVDIQEGVPPLKLPYNVSENPYLAAQRFLQNNDLPLTYLDEVVRFIEKNTAGVTLGASSNDFVDPYTGRSAYRAGSAPSTTFTQGGGNPDPFTGASSRRPPAATAKPKLLPVKAPLSFKQANLTAMRTKIHQLNDAAVADPALMSQVLAPEEVATLDTIFTFLTDASTDASFDPAVQQQLDNLEIELLVSILDRWDESRRFPVLDLARLVAAFSPGAFAGDGESLHFARALLVAADVQAGWASVPLPKTRDTNTLLALRTLANVAQFANSDASAQWVAPVFAELKKVPYAALGKQHRIALATIVLNISVMAVKGRKQLVGAEVLEVLNQVLLGEDSEPEAAYRGLISLGNLAFVVAPGSQAVLKSLLAPALVLSAKFKEPRFRDIESELRLQAK